MFLIQVPPDLRVFANLFGLDIFPGVFSNRQKSGNTYALPLCYLLRISEFIGSFRAIPGRAFVQSSLSRSGPVLLLQPCGLKV